MFFLYPMALFTARSWRGPACTHAYEKLVMKRISTELPARGKPGALPHGSRAVAAISPSLDSSIGIVVCIPSFRRPQHLRLTLESLAAQRTNHRFAVVIVD